MLCGTWRPSRKRCTSTETRTSGGPATEQRAIDLFTALKGSGKKWMGFGSLRPVLSPAGKRMLNAARESGMLTAWVGWDAMTDDGSEGLRCRRENRGRPGGSGAHDQGPRHRCLDCSTCWAPATIPWMISNARVELCDRLGVSMHPSLVVPYPGTKLREQYEPYLYKDMGWEYYTGAYALFEHPDPAMTPETPGGAVLRNLARSASAGEGAACICSGSPGEPFLTRISFR